MEKDGERIEIEGRRYRASANESNAHTAAVLAGLGISQAARFAAAPHIASGELVAVMQDWKHPPIPLHVVYPPDRPRAALTTSARRASPQIGWKSLWKTMCDRPQRES